MTTISEALEELHTAIDDMGLSPMEHGVCDDEDMIVFALNYLRANLWDSEVFDKNEE